MPYNTVQHSTLRTMYLLYHIPTKRDLFDARLAHVISPRPSPSRTVAVPVARGSSDEGRSRPSWLGLALIGSVLHSVWPWMSLRLCPSMCAAILDDLMTPLVGLEPHSHWLPPTRRASGYRPPWCQGLRESLAAPGPGDQHRTVSAPSTAKG